MKLRSFIPLALFISFSLKPCTSEKNIPQPKPGEPVYEVTAITPRLVDVPRSVTATGDFAASDQLTIKAELAGKIEKVYVSEGDQVEVDAPLCILKSEGLNSLLEKKQAELKEAEATLEHHQQTLEITGGTPPVNPNGKETVFLDDTPEEKPIPSKFKEESQKIEPEPKPTTPPTDLASQIHLDEARIELLNKELDILENELQNLTVKAPIAGMIKNRKITEGSQILPNDELFEIVTINPITLSIHVPQEVSSYIDKLIKVKAAPVSAPELAYEGNIYYISPGIDPASKTLEIRLHLPNENGLIKEGQKGQALVTTRKIDKIFSVPKNLLIQENLDSYIYVINGPKVTKVKVKVLKNEDDQWYEPQGKPWTQDSVASHGVLTQQGSSPEPTSVGDKEVQIDANIRVDDLIVSSGHENLIDGSFVKHTLDKVATP